MKRTARILLVSAAIASLAAIVGPRAPFGAEEDNSLATTGGNQGAAPLDEAISRAATVVNRTLPPFDEVISRAATVVNRTLPPFDEAISRAATVVNRTLPPFDEAISRAATVVNRTLPPFDEAISRAATACNVAGLEVLDAALDIKPGSCPNALNPNSRGVLPVALLSTDAVDVQGVILSSVRLARADGVGGQVAPNEGPPGPHSVFEDVATPFDDAVCNCHTLEGDGIVDLSMKFRTEALAAALQLDDVATGAVVELVLTGVLADCTPFEARDCVRLVRPIIRDELDLGLLADPIGGASPDESAEDSEPDIGPMPGDGA